MSRYTEREPFESKLTKLYNFPLYLFRKANYYLCYSLLTAAAGLAKAWGFYLDYELEDDEAWKWYLRAKLPIYTARIERKD